MNKIRNQLQQFQEMGIWYSLYFFSIWATAISISIFIISGVSLIALSLTGNKTPQALKKANYGSCGFAVGFILFASGAAIQGDKNTSYRMLRLSSKCNSSLINNGNYLSYQCLNCKHASGNKLLPCATNPMLQKDEDCSYFENN